MPGSDANDDHSAAGSPPGNTIGVPVAAEAHHQLSDRTQSPTTHGERADVVLRGGTVHTVAPGGWDASALAIRDGRVMWVGADTEISDLIGARTEVINLDGRTVLPGINDAHLHATWLGAVWPDTLFGQDPVPGPGPQRPLHDDQDRRRAILAAGDLLAGLGITSYTEPGLGPGEDGGPTGAFDSSVVGQYRALAAEGLLRTRVTVLSLYGEVDGHSDLDVFLAGIADRDPSSPDPQRLQFAGVKIFADGIAPMGSAYTHRCYADGSRAELLVAGRTDADREQNLAQMIIAAHRAGLQVGVHATGDRSIEVVLDAVATARTERDIDLGHYVIHGDLVTAAQLSRMAQLGVGLNTQAGIAVRTHHLLENVVAPTNGAMPWPLRTALDAGIGMCLSTDAPVLSPDWRQEIAAADQWLGPATNPRTRMQTLLRCYTIHPAAQDGAASWKGSLSPGMAADLCVLEADPLALPAAELPDVGVDLTMLAGAVVYKRHAQAR